MLKVMVFGTFDGLHAGHLNFFKQAKKFGDQLMIVVARDQNVKKIKGHRPKLGERKRLKALKPYGDKVILGGLNDPYAVIRRLDPDIICLGYDQKSFDKPLTKMFPKINIIRLKSFRPNIYKSSLIRNK
jgi:FAD synthetase